VWLFKLKSDWKSVFLIDVYRANINKVVRVKRTSVTQLTHAHTHWRTRIERNYLIATGRWKSHRIGVHRGCTAIDPFHRIGTPHRDGFAIMTSLLLHNSNCLRWVSILETELVSQPQHCRGDIKYTFVCVCFFLSLSS